MYATLLICISNHAFLVHFKYKCLYMPYNKLLIDLAFPVSIERYWTEVFFVQTVGRGLYKKTEV